MKAKDWQTPAKLIRERQSQATTADSSPLSSFPLSELPLDDSGPPTVLQGPYVPLSTSTAICVSQDKQPPMDSAPDKSPFQQMIPSILQQSLYPSLAAVGTSINTAVSPSIPFARKVINDIEEQQRKTLKNTVEGIIRLTNISPIPEEEGKEEEVITPSFDLQAHTTQADTQEETLQLESSKIEDTGTKQVFASEDQNVGPTEAQNIEHTNERTVLNSIDSQIEDDGSTPENNDQDPAMQDEQMSKASQDDNYHTAIDDDDLDDTIQFGNPVTQPFLSRSIRMPTTEVGCLSFTQMFQGYLHEYPPPSQADAYSQIQAMAQRLDMYLNQHPAQYINCMTSDSEFVAFVNHTIQMPLI